MSEKIMYAENANYFRTGHSSPDTWIDRASNQIIKLGGKVHGHGFGTGHDGRSAYMLAFEIKGEFFKVVWPVLPHRYTGNESAARIQAATMLFHDIKAKCISSVVLGVRAAFFSYFVLPDGRTAAEVATPELTAAIPGLFISGPKS